MHGGFVHLLEEATLWLTLLNGFGNLGHIINPEATGGSAGVEGIGMELY
jgi:hypothetical protein